MKYLNEKLVQGKHMSRGVLLLKNKSRKRSQKQNKRKSKKRKQHGGSKNFKLLHQLLSADLNSDVIDNVNVESLARLSVRQVRWLTKMAKNGRLTERAITTGAPNDNFRKNICSENDLRSRIFGTFVVKFLACLSLLGFSDI